MVRLEQLLVSAGRQAQKQQNDQRKAEERERRRRVKERKLQQETARKRSRSESRAVTRRQCLQLLAESRPLPKPVSERIIKAYGLSRCNRCKRVLALADFKPNSAYCECIECQRAALPRTRSLESHFKQLYTSAWDRSIKFLDMDVPDLTFEWFVSELDRKAWACALCGDPMTCLNPRATERTGRREMFAAPLNISLDRADPRLGYTTTNVQLTHLRCNIMKSYMLPDEFVELCGKIASLPRN